MSASTPLITIFGATGNQGSAVARSLLRNPSFKVRALTRNPSSNASQALISQGAEIKQADGFDFESMVSAFTGSWGVFVNTNSDEKSIREKGLTEFEFGKVIVDAAAAAGVCHFIFSTGANSLELTGGKVELTAWLEKHNIEQYARSIGSFETASFIAVAWYLEMFSVKEIAPFFGGFPHLLDSEGYLTFVAPKWGGKEEVPFVSISEDLGDIVHGMFLDPVRCNGKVVHGCSDICSFDEVTSQFERITGRKSRFQPLGSWKDFDTHGFPISDDAKSMFEMTQESGGLYFGPEASEKETASELKRKATLKLGMSEEEQQLMTVGSWFRKHSPAWCT